MTIYSALPSLFHGLRQRLLKPRDLPRQVRLVTVLALLMTSWLVLAPLLWEALHGWATGPQGGYPIFFVGGTLIVLRMQWRRAMAARRAVVAGHSSGGFARLVTRPAIPAEVLRRRAHHEAAHAVAGWALGARITVLDIRCVGDRGGQCGFSLEEQTDLTERSWVNLVICMAGNQADLSNGHHDTGAQSDLAQALVAAAGVISTGRSPRAHAGELTSDALLASARDLASSLLAQHRTLVERVTQELLDRPDSTWENPDLDSLTRDQAS